jgi:uncharacterized delta-60 repeat protein
LARLTTNFTLDTTFNPNVNGAVTALALQGNGQLVLAGTFSSVGGVPETNLARVNSTGSVDTSFSASANGSVTAVALQANGQILLGGSFSAIDGVARANLARINSNGTIDASFNPGPNGPIASISVLTSGQIMLAGSFTAVAGAAHSNVARLNSNGTADGTFTSTTDGAVNALAVQSDGKVYLGGLFNNVDGSTRFRFARLGATAGAYQYLTLNSGFTSATWTRGGNATEVSQVQVQLSTDGENWTNIGAASRIGSTSSWQITGLSLPGSSVFYLQVLGAAPTSQAASSGLMQIEQEFDSATGYTGPTVPSSLSSSSSADLIFTPAFVSDAILSSAGATGASATGSANGGASGTATRLITFSSQANVTPEDPLIAGFTISGSAPEAVLLRAVGPSLSLFGVQNVIENPYLQLYDSTGHLVLANAGWDGDSNLASLFDQVGAFPLIVGSADSAAVAYLAPGSYTVQVGGANGQTGAVLAEVYNADSAPLTSTQQISAVSARAGVDASHSLVGGIVVAGGSTRTVLVRAVGPALGNSGISNPLPAPVLSIYDSQGNLVAQNAGWSSQVSVNAAYPASSAAGIATAAASVGASALTSGSNDSAVIVTLPPGTYTAQITDGSGQPGIALVEVYDVNP